jgi:protein subunit release factor A
MSTFVPSVTSSVIIEIRAAEGGEDAKSLVDEQLRIYARRALHHGL